MTTYTWNTASPEFESSDMKRSDRSSLVIVGETICRIRSETSARAVLTLFQEIILNIPVSSAAIDLIISGH